MKCLLIDEDVQQRNLTAEAISSFPYMEIIAVDSQDAFNAHLAQNRFDVVICEYQLSWTDGITLFKQLHDRYACVPVIMLTAFGDEALAVKAIKSGMANYLAKHNRQALNEAIADALSNSQKQNPCKDADKNLLLCEKWDLKFSSLISDYTYAMRILPDKTPVYEWVSDAFEPLISKQPQSTENPLTSVNDITFNIHPDDAAIVQKRYKQLLLGIENISEYRILAPDNSCHHLKDHAHPERDKLTGKITHIYGAIQDVTQQRQREEQLHLLKTAIESCNDSIMITEGADSDYAIVYANPAFLKLTRYSLEEILGKNCRILQKDDQNQVEIAQIRQAITNGSEVSVILRNYRKDGSMFWNSVHISPIRNAQNNITHFVGVQNDVSEYHQMEAMLTRKEAKLRAIFNSVFDGIFIVDEHGLIESTNPAIEKIFRYPNQGLVGKHIQLLISDMDWSWHEIFSHHRQLKMGSKTIFSAHETFGLRLDGSTFPMDLTIIEINLENRHVFICTVHDVSKHKQAEDALRKLGSHLELAREEERARIAREIHDELGSFLTVLKMDMSWLNKQLPAHLPLCVQKTENIIQQVGDAIQTVRRIINDLRPSILDHLGLLPAIEWQVDKFRQQSGVDCITQIPEISLDIDDKHSMAIYRILQETLTNIILHAMATVVIIKIHVNQTHFHMHIEDNGCGMTPGQLANTQRYGIKGMHERARYFGGELKLIGHPGQGVIVRLHMPIHASSEGVYSD